MLLGDLRIPIRRPFSRFFDKFSRGPLGRFLNTEPALGSARVVSPFASGGSPLSCPDLRSFSGAGEICPQNDFPLLNSKNGRKILIRFSLLYYISFCIHQTHRMQDSFISPRKPRIMRWPAHVPEFRRQLQTRPLLRRRIQPAVKGPRFRQN